MSEDEYPTDEEIRRIEDWPMGDPRGMVEYVESVWSHFYGKMWRTPRRVKFATGGWSGNEDIIGALHRNIWGMCYWVKTERGGYHEYAYPPLRMQSDNKESGCIVPDRRELRA